jgi:hypothetical protein
MSSGFYLFTSLTTAHKSQSTVLTEFHVFYFETGLYLRVLIICLFAPFSMNDRCNTAIWSTKPITSNYNIKRSRIWQEKILNPELWMVTQLVPQITARERAVRELCSRNLHILWSLPWWGYTERIWDHGFCLNCLLNERQENKILIKYCNELQKIIIIYNRALKYPKFLLPLFSNIMLVIPF